jgi:hypothetical protein
MPVNIYRVLPEGTENKTIAKLCKGEWRLTPQSEALSDWLQEHGTSLGPARYVANIGFSWRRDACSGGPAFKPETLGEMARLGMSLFISEYAGFTDEMDQEGDVTAMPSNTSLERTREG